QDRAEARQSGHSAPPGECPSNCRSLRRALKAASTGVARRATDGPSCPRVVVAIELCYHGWLKPDFGPHEAEDRVNVSLYLAMSCGRALRPFVALTSSTTLQTVSDHSERSGECLKCG